MNLREELKQLGTSASDLRKFGLMVGGVFTLLALFCCWRGKAFYLYFLLPAVPLLVMGLLYPTALRRVYLGWMTLALMMGCVVSSVLLTLLFYLVVTPIGCGLRLAGKDFLALRRKGDESTYWRRRESVAMKGDFEKQY